MAFKQRLVFKYLKFNQAYVNNQSPLLQIKEYTMGIHMDH